MIKIFYAELFDIVIICPQKIGTLNNGYICYKLKVRLNE